MKHLNIATYKFVEIDKSNLDSMRVELYQKCSELALKGTILLSEEGINLFLAGGRNNIILFQEYLQNHALFRDLTYRETWSQKIPFSRLIVRIKAEIIAMGKPEIRPQHKTAPYITPKNLKNG